MNGIWGMRMIVWEFGVLSEGIALEVGILDMLGLGI